MAKLRKLIVLGGSKIYGVFELKKYKLKGETIFEKTIEDERFIAWIDQKPKGVEEWLQEEIQNKINELTAKEEKEKEDLQVWLQALKAFEVPIEYEGYGDDDED